MIQAHFFDIFGVLGFIILFCIGLRITEEKKLKYYGYAIMLIGVIGFVIDNYTVLTNFIFP